MANIALVYDADYTLMDGYHPSTILRRRGIVPEEFWKKVSGMQARELAKGEKTAVDIIYLAHIMHEIRYGKLKDLTIKELEECANDVENMLYPGLPDFFDTVKLNHPGARISHNIVSVGIKHILEHTSIGKRADNVFGYTFFDDLTDNPYIDEIRSTQSSDEKVAAITKISIGETNHMKYDFPIANMIYFGDGQTDRPAFRFVRKKGGLAICVYNPDKPGAFEKAKKMRGDVHYILPAKFTQGSALWHVVSSFIKTRESFIQPRIAD